MSKLLKLTARGVIRLGAAVALVYTKVWARQRLHWFDHDFDYLRGPSSWYWQERGVLGVGAIAAGAKVLDIGCGDGFYDINYFATRAAHIDALDRDIRALPRTQHRKIHFSACNIVSDPFPGSQYDVIVCFSVLQQMNEAELSNILPKLRSALKQDGVFFGSVSIMAENAIMRSQSDVNDWLASAFRVTELHCSQWPGDRVECYFRCT